MVLGVRHHRGKAGFLRNIVAPFDHGDIMPCFRKKIRSADTDDAATDYYNLFFCHLSAARDDYRKGS